MQVTDGRTDRRHLHDCSPGNPVASSVGPESEGPQNYLYTCENECTPRGGEKVFTEMCVFGGSHVVERLSPAGSGSGCLSGVLELHAMLRRVPLLASENVLRSSVIVHGASLSLRQLLRSPFPLGGFSFGALEA